MNIDVRLIVISHGNLSAKSSVSQTQVLTSSETDRRLPPSPVLEDDKTSLEMAASTLEFYTGLKALIGGVGWITLKQLPVIDHIDRINIKGERVVTIPYFCLVPPDVNLKYGVWTSVFSTDIPDNHRQLINLAINHI